MLGDGGLFDLVYGELRVLAGQVWRRESPGHTLQPTALVHEVWMRLRPSLAEVNDRTHFLAIAARAMRRVLRDHARARATLKRADRRAGLDVEEVACPAGGIDALELDEAMERLVARNPRHGAIAELRLFGGLTLEEVARELDVSLRTVEGDWRFVKAWLADALDG